MDKDISDMKLTLLYVLCPLCLDNAERKRQEFIQKTTTRIVETADIPRRRESTGAMLEVNGNGQEIVAGDGRSSVFSMAMSVTRMLSVTTDRKLIESGKSVSVIFYDFDGVLTVSQHRLFEEWNLSAISSLRKRDLFETFGREERIERLRAHLSTALGKGIKIYCLGQETRAKLKAILSKIDFYPTLFNEETIIGADHPLIRKEDEKHNRTQIFLLHWMKENSVSNEECLLVSAVEENTRLFADNGTCHTYLPGSASQKRPTQERDFGITINDFEVIEQTF